jgi:CheY-like chemotaxis protein
MPNADYPARILIVDDEPELRELLADALEDGQSTIHLAASGKEAVELARQTRPDLIITDLYLGDCTGLDMMDRLAEAVGNIPTVVITGHGDVQTLTEASRRRPVELMTKPLNLERLRQTVMDELLRQDHDRRTAEEICEYFDAQEPARQSLGNLRQNNAELAVAYRQLSQNVLGHQRLVRYQLEMIGARNDDDVFRNFFRTYVRQCGAINGAALVCDANAELRIAGRFGVPHPDSLEFCRCLTEPIIDLLLANPQVQLIDAMDEPESFPPEIQRCLPGITILAIPLIPAPGEMIGTMVLYRRGEQPFTDEDIELGQLMAFPTALAVRRND